MGSTAPVHEMVAWEHWVREVEVTRISLTACQCSHDDGPQRGYRAKQKRTGCTGVDDCVCARVQAGRQCRRGEHGGGGKESGEHGDCRRDEEGRLDLVVLVLLLSTTQSKYTAPFAFACVMLMSSSRVTRSLTVA